MRQVKIRSLRAAHNPALIPMIQEGWDIGVKTYTQFHETRRKRREPVAKVTRSVSSTGRRYRAHDRNALPVR